MTTERKALYKVQRKEEEDDYREEGTMRSTRKAEEDNYQGLGRQHRVVGRAKPHVRRKKEYSRRRK